MRKKIVIDIRPPASARKRHLRVSFFRSAGREPQPKIIYRGRSLLPRRFLTFALALVLVFTAFTGFSAFGYASLKKSVTQTAPLLYANLAQAKDALANLETAKARDSLSAIAGQVEAVHEDAQKYGLLALAKLFSAAAPKLKAIPDAFAAAIDITKTAVQAAAELDDLKSNAFAYLMTGRGTVLTNRLSSLSQHVSRLASLSNALQEQSGVLGSQSFPIDALGAQVDLLKAERFLATLTGWLTTDATKHFLVLF